MNIIFLGAPGAGKGTQAEIAAKDYDIPTLSTGVMLREAVKVGSELGKEAEGFMTSGALVPDEIVIGIIKERLKAPDCKKGFILDGFPRTTTQAEVLEKMGVNIDLVIDIEVPDAAIINRMSGRRACPTCGATYHVAYKPSKNGTHCDVEGHALVQRDDDKPETVQNRLKIYHEKTAPISDFYKKRGKLVTVAGQEELSDTTRLTREAIKKALKL